MSRVDWFVVSTTSSGERLAKEDLQSYGFEVFLPIEIVRMRPARHRRDRAMRTVERPLFGRYLFVGMPAGWHDFAGVRRSKRVQDFLRDSYGCPVQIRSAVVEAIQADMSLGRYDEAATKARKEAERLKALTEQMGQIRVGQEFTMQNGLWKGFLATVTAVGRKEIRIEVKGDSGATLSLGVSGLFASEIGLLSGSTKGDGINGAL